MREVHRIVWAVGLAVVLGACGRSGSLPTQEEEKCGCTHVVVVTPELSAAEATLGEKAGAVREVATSRDEGGVQSDFVIGEALLHPGSDAALQAFLDRYGGEVLSDDRVPEPPPDLGVTLLPDERVPRGYLVRFDLGSADFSTLSRDAAAVGLDSRIEVSSREALRTVAVIANAAAAGFAVSPNFVRYPAQFPRTVFSTRERGDRDAFQIAGFGDAGEASNVTAAWQFVWAHGIQRRVRVAIIDAGFWLDSSGAPLRAPGDGTDLDNFTSYDFDAGSSTLRGPANPATCTGNRPCPWHGNRSAGVAVGLVDNRAGAAGTGGIVSDPMLLHADVRDLAQVLWAVRTATGWGADVINMSFGGPCNYLCRQLERFYRLAGDDYADANARSVVLVASAGNDDADVAADNFYHPCLIDHVICVGAIDPAAAKQSYSNFGAGVDIWAPTDIEVMADGATAGALGNHSGTSASAPFVAGVAALMKAIDPTLTSDRVAGILRDTGHPGVDEVDLYVDAFAAVLRAAEGIAAVRDRYEPNGPGSPHVIGASIPWSATDLNLHAANDVDSYAFQSASRTRVKVSVDHPRALGDVSVVRFEAGESCGPPVLVSDDAAATGKRTWIYQVPAGAAEISIGGGPLASYLLEIDYEPAGFLFADANEPNDTAAAPTPLHGRVAIWNGTKIYAAAIDLDATVDANLHRAGDVDWYVLRGSNSTPSGGGLFDVRPAVTLYANESPISMRVFEQRADGTAGALVAQRSLAQCDGTGVSVDLRAGDPYLVEVSGDVGRYSLTNGVTFRFDKSRLPVEVRTSPFDFVRPGPPVERFIRFPVNYLFVADPAFTAVDLTGDRVHLELYDLAGTLIATGAPKVGFDESLDLSATAPGLTYLLRASPTAPADEGVEMTLSWNQRTPSRSSGNLIRNPGAEDGPDNPAGGPVQAIAEWTPYPDGAVQLHRLPTYAHYGDPTVSLDASSPGPIDRGRRFFAGGAGALAPRMIQGTLFDAGWMQAIVDGGVRYELSAFLGGVGDLHDGPHVRIWFAGPQGEVLEEAFLGPVGPAERGGTTGLVPVGAAGFVPSGAVGVGVELWFPRLDPSNAGGFADNLELVLHDFTR